MKTDLTVKEEQYVNRILDILKSSGVSPSYREDAKIQLIDHIQEARLNNDDFRNDLGSPEDFALNFIETAGMNEDNPIQERGLPSASYDQNKKVFSFKPVLAFLSMSAMFYFILQFITVLTLTPALAPGMGFDFHLFKISDYLWWNLLAIAINILLALSLGGITMKLLGRRYRFS
jgi:hypothetical protein